MRTFGAFLKKEIMDLMRSGRFVLLVIIFVLFGIMNPAMAKLTPWLMQTMSESLENTGLSITEITVDAMSSWTQYYKNAQMAVIVFVLVISNILTKEYQSGTLILVLTKGFSRVKVILAKTGILFAVWSICYWLCLGITYVYNDYFWDNSVAAHWMFAAVCYWLFGVWLISVIMLFSAIAKSNTIVLLGVAAVYAGLNILAMFRRIASYLPIKLTAGLSILSGETVPSDYRTAIWITIITAVVMLVAAVMIFNKRMLPASREE